MKFKKGQIILLRNASQGMLPGKLLEKINLIKTGKYNPAKEIFNHSIQLINDDTLDIERITINTDNEFNKISALFVKIFGLNFGLIYFFYINDCQCFGSIKAAKNLKEIIKMRDRSNN